MTGGAAPLPRRPGAAPASVPNLAGARWALMFGNFVIGFGIMAVPGTLPSLASSLGVTIAVAGQLIAVGAAVVCFGAPLLAGWVAAFDRRRLLALSLAGYGIGHALCALMPSFAALLPVRALTVLGAAVFTPQAAAAIGFMSPPEERGRSITFIFLGWSLASVLGLPLAAWMGDAWGWPSAFHAVAFCAMIAAAWVYAVIPDGVRPAPISFAAWKRALSSPLLMAIVAVTFLSGAGQFTLFSYLKPYYSDVLRASSTESALLLMTFGVFGIVGSILMTRFIDRAGAGPAATVAVGLMALSLLLWPLGTGILAIGLVMIPWGLGCFSGNSAQQARLSEAAPALAPALMALNTSAIYLGQAAGASSGGWLVAHRGYGALHGAGLAWLAVAIAVSVWAVRRASMPR